MEKDRYIYLSLDVIDNWRGVGNRTFYSFDICFIDKRGQILVTDEPSLNRYNVHSVQLPQ